MNDDEFDFTPYDYKPKAPYLWIAAGIVAILLVFGAVQCQIGNLSTKQRKLDCALITKTDGTTRKATDFEYYECIGK